jgi:hypothetical protein
MKHYFVMLPLWLALGATTASSSPPLKVEILDVNTEVNENPGELVLAVANLSSKRYTEFTEQLVKISGIIRFEHCPGAEVFLVTYDSQVFANAEEAFASVAKELNSFRLLQKLGVSHAELKAAC